MQTTNNTSACASCKHQRKKCTEKCILAAFFPVEKTREFQAVHKVFGVSNVTKIIMNLKEDDRRRAVDSLVWEALCRQKEPVLGPYGEYRRICEELRLYKTQYQQFHQLPTQGRRIIHKAPAGITGWNNNDNNNNKAMSNINIVTAGGINNSNNNNNNNNNNSLSNIHNNNGNSMMGFFPYGYSSHHMIKDIEKITTERENDSAIILSQQHDLANNFNHQFFLTGQFNHMDSKSMESTLWEGSSS